LRIASEKIILCFVVPKQKQQPVSNRRRSLCPLNASVEILGDRWSLLILRDMMLRNAHTFKAFLECAEGIATNILADRLRRLEADGIITARADPADGRKQIYQLTRKGIDLAPVLTEMVLWAGKHEEVGNHALIRLMRKDKARFLAEIFRRWAETNKQ
jgi:DNA-binding HxlR family transcriptional regulator